MVAADKHTVPTSTIPCFPLFTQLGIDHGAAIEGLVTRYAPYADFTFVNLYTWSINDQAEVSLLHDNLVVKLPDYMTGVHTYSIIGSYTMDDSIESLLSLTDSLHLVPEIVIDSIESPDKFIITEDRDGHDYMYDLERLVALEGKRLKNKRNKLNKFKNYYGDRISYETVSKLSARQKEEIKALFKRWATENNKTANESLAESIAIDRLLAHFNHLGLLITIVYIDKKMCAFSVNEILPNGHAICHFEKALKDYEGAYTFVINRAAADLLARGCIVVNWEQDLGLPGLRTAKTSYQPVDFLRKYTITSR